MIYVDFLVCRGKSGRKKLLWTNCYSLATLPLPGIQICKQCFGRLALLSREESCRESLIVILPLVCWSVKLSEVRVRQ